MERPPKETRERLPKLTVQETGHGKGVFAEAPIKEGAEILPFGGERLRTDELPTPYNEVEDHFVQIGEDLYMGPSGGIDDLFNHSCDPNAGLKIHGEDAVLVAIRDIKTGEEITWDYSTTMDEDDWELACGCGSPHCRGKVGDFKHLAPELKRRYASLGIVPSYLMKYVSKT